MRKTIAVVVAAVLLGACASAPEPVAPPDDAYNNAKALRAEIQQNDLAQYAQSDYAAGEASFTAAEAAYQAEDYAAASEGFDAAITSYTNVLREGYGSVARTKRTGASEQKQKADDIKANVAVADDYTAALDVYDKAIAAADAGDNKKAAELFDNASTLFSQVYEAAAEKRRKALEAVGRVDSKINELDQQRTTLETQAREDLETDTTTEGGN